MYFEQNMQLMQEHRRNLYELLQKQVLSKADKSIKVESIPTRVQEKALLVEKGGIQYRLNSKYNPIEEAQRWAEQHSAKNLDTVFTMFGLGNGIFLKALLKGLTGDNKVIVYEPSLQIFIHVMQEYDLQDIIIDEKIMLIIHELNESEFPYFVSVYLTWMNLFSLRECVHPGYDLLFDQIYATNCKILQDNTFNNIVSRNTFEIMGTPVVENTMTNMVHLKESISIWDLNKKIDKDTTVIIAAAGPSLHKNIDELKRAKGHAIIITVDRAYETFLEHGIEPDFVIILDAKKPLKYCGNVKGFTTPLLYEFEASPDILDNHNGKKILYSFGDFLSKLFREVDKSYPQISFGGSVTTAAFAICAKLGFKRIVLIGCDMAYDGEKSHSGNIQEVVADQKDLINIFVEDIYGNTVRTRHDWYTFLRWFEYVIMQLKNTDVIDATEGGAKIKGTRILTLKEVVENYCNVDIDCEKIINETEPCLNQKEVQTIYQFLSKAQEDLIEINIQAKNALKHCRVLSAQLKKCQSLSSNPKLLDSIAKINETIEEKPIFELVDYYTLGHGTNSINALFFMTNDKETDDMVTVNNMTNIYNLTIEACEFLLPKLEAILSDYK